MRDRWLANLLLLVLILTLGALMRRELGQENKVETLTGLRPENITEIRIERSDEPAIRLVQQPGGWRMEAPYRVVADAGRIGQLVGIAATPVHRSLPVGTDMGQLGLAADGLTLTMNGLVLRFGDVDPLAHQRYVAIGEQVHLIGDGFYHHLMAPAVDYVDRALLPPDFRPATGTLDGEPLTPEDLALLPDLAAESLEPLGSMLTGRILELTAEDAGPSLRFLVTGDGLAWSRLDLRLRYLVAEPPVWAIAGVPDPDAAEAPAGGDTVAPEFAEEAAPTEPAPTEAPPPDASPLQSPADTLD